MTENFNNLSLRLKFALKVLNISQSELAKRIHVKPQVIQYLCASQSQKSRFTFEIAEALDIDFSWLATGKGTIPASNEVKRNENCIPLLSFEQIKTWKINGNEIEASKINHWVSMDGEISSNCFAVEINDRAMAPRFDLNTIIIVEYIEKKYLEPNSFVLVYLPQENFIIFRHLHVINNQRFLVAINKNLHKDIALKEEDIILGICKEARWSV
jgi:transcriptional regulator with XRE-family HTH domain